MAKQALDDALAAGAQAATTKRRAEELDDSDIEEAEMRPGTSVKRVKPSNIIDDVDMLGPLDEIPRPEHMSPESIDSQKASGRTPSSHGSWVHTPSETSSGLCTPEVDPEELALLLDQHAHVSPYGLDTGSPRVSRSQSPTLSGRVTPLSPGSPLHSSRSVSPDIRSLSRSPSPNEDNTDITRDPDFFDAEELPDPKTGAEDEEHDPPGHGTANHAPRALSEHSWIRKCYLSSFIQHMYHGAHDDAISVQLKLDRVGLLDVRKQTGIDIPGLDKMAVTRLAAERRLGLDPNKHIIFELSCTDCWEPYALCDLDDLQSPKCTQAGCDGDLYKTRTVSDGRMKRVPCRIVSRSPLIPALERMMQRPGKPAQYNSWRRGDEDKPGAMPPLAAPPGDGDDAYPNGSYRIHSITEAWGFRAIPAFLERQRGAVHGHWEFRDVNTNGRSQRFVALPNGIVFMINMDWFQPMKRSAFGSHSTGVVFATVVNNPDPIRFHRREMFFLIAIPGPSEPDAAATSKLLDRVVDEFEVLNGGVHLHIDGFAEKQPVHGHCYLDLSDLPARES